MTESRYIYIAGTQATCSIFVSKVRQSTTELEALIAAVRNAKGHDDYQSYSDAVAIQDRTGILKARPQYHELSKRIVKTVSRKDVQKYLAKLCIKADLAQSAIIPNEAQPEVSSMLRDMAVAAMRNYLKTFKGDKQNEGLDIIIDALPKSERNPDIVASLKIKSFGIDETSIVVANVDDDARSCRLHGLDR